MVRAEAELAAHGLEAGRLERGAERVGLGHVPADGLERAGDEAGRVIALAGVERGQAAVLRLEVLDEEHVGRVVQVLVPLRGVDHAERRVADRAQDRLIEGECRAEDWNLAGQAGLGVLLQERDAHAAGQEEEHRVGLRRSRKAAISAA